MVPTMLDNVCKYISMVDNDTMVVTMVDHRSINVVVYQVYHLGSVLVLLPSGHATAHGPSSADKTRHMAPQRAAARLPGEFTGRCGPARLTQLI